MAARVSKSGKVYYDVGPATFDFTGGNVYINGSHFALPDKKKAQESLPNRTQYVLDYNDPYVINSISDAITNVAAKQKRYGSWTGNATVDNILQTLPAVLELPFQLSINPVVGSVKQALTDTSPETTFFSGLGEGLMAAGVNTLQNVGETVDILANPIKGMVLDKEGPLTGYMKAVGIPSEKYNPGGGRYNYDYDVDSAMSFVLPESIPLLGGIEFDLADIALEMISDPLNWVSFGAASLAKGAAKAGVSAVTKEVAQETGEEIAQSTVRRISRQLAKKVLAEGGDVTNIAKRVPDIVNDTGFFRGVKSILRNHEDEFSEEVSKRLASRLSESISNSTLKSIDQLSFAGKAYNASEKLQGVLFKAGMGAGLLPYGAYKTYKLGKNALNNRAIHYAKKAGVKSLADLVSNKESLYAVMNGVDKMTRDQTYRRLVKYYTATEQNTIQQLNKTARRIDDTINSLVNKAQKSKEGDVRFIPPTSEELTQLQEILNTSVEYVHTIIKSHADTGIKTFADYRTYVEDLTTNGVLDKQYLDQLERVQKILKLSEDTSKYVDTLKAINPDDVTNDTVQNYIKAAKEYDTVLKDYRSYSDKAPHLQRDKGYKQIRQLGRDVDFDNTRAYQENMQKFLHRKQNNYFLDLPNYKMLDTNTFSEETLNKFTADVRIPLYHMRNRLEEGALDLDWLIDDELISRAGRLLRELKKAPDDYARILNRRSTAVSLEELQAIDAELLNLMPDVTLVYNEGEALIKELRSLFTAYHPKNKTVLTKMRAGLDPNVVRRAGEALNYVTPLPKAYNNSQVYHDVQQHFTDKVRTYTAQLSNVYVYQALQNIEELRDLSIAVRTDIGVGATLNDLIKAGEEAVNNTVLSPDEAMLAIEKGIAASKAQTVLKQVSYYSDLVEALYSIPESAISTEAKHGILDAFIKHHDSSAYTDTRSVNTLVESLCKSADSYSIANLAIEKRNLEAFYKKHTGKEMVGAHDAEADAVQYLEALLSAQTAVAKEAPLLTPNQRLVSFDLETIGDNRHSDAIIQIGVAHQDATGHVVSRSWVINNDDRMPNDDVVRKLMGEEDIIKAKQLFTEKFHDGKGLSDSAVYCNTEAEGLAEFYDYLRTLAQDKELVMSAYNGYNFDFPFLQRRTSINFTQTENARAMEEVVYNAVKHDGYFETLKAAGLRYVSPEGKTQLRSVLNRYFDAMYTTQDAHDTLFERLNPYDADLYKNKAQVSGLDFVPEHGAFADDKYMLRSVDKNLNTSLTNLAELLEDSTDPNILQLTETADKIRKQLIKVTDTNAYLSNFYIDATELAKFKDGANIVNMLIAGTPTKVPMYGSRVATDMNLIGNYFDIGSMLADARVKPTARSLAERMQFDRQYGPDMPMLEDLTKIARGIERTRSKLRYDGAMDAFMEYNEYMFRVLQEGAQDAGLVGVQLLKPVDDPITQFAMNRYLCELLQTRVFDITDIPAVFKHTAHDPTARAYLFEALGKGTDVDSWRGIRSTVTDYNDAQDFENLIPKDVATNLMETAQQYASQIEHDKMCALDAYGKFMSHRGLYRGSKAAMVEYMSTWQGHWERIMQIITEATDADRDMRLMKKMTNTFENNANVMSELAVGKVLQSSADELLDTMWLSGGRKVFFRPVADLSPDTRAAWELAGIRVFEQPINEGVLYYLIVDKNKHTFDSLLSRGRHTVVADDTFENLAAFYGIDIDTLLRINNAKAGTSLKIGQELVVPHMPQLTQIEDLIEDMPALNRVLMNARHDLAKMFPDLGDTTGGILDDPLIQRFAVQMPEEAAQYAIDVEWSELLKHPHSNHMVIGDVRTQRYFNPYATASLMKQYTNSAKWYVKHLEPITKYSSMFFNDEMSINSGFFETLTPKQMVQLFKDRDDFVCAVLLEDKRSKTGVSVRQIQLNTVEAVREARTAHAVILPTNVYRVAANNLNGFVLPSVLRVMNAAAMTYKCGYLSSLGWLARNIMDAFVKNRLSLDHKASLPKVITHWLETAKQLHDYTEILKQIEGVANGKYLDDLTIAKFFEEHPDLLSRAKVKTITTGGVDTWESIAQQNKITVDTLRQYNPNMPHILGPDMSLQVPTYPSFFHVVHNFMVNGPSGGIMETLTKQLGNMAKNKTGSVLDDAIAGYSNFIGNLPLLKQLHNMNGTIERINRLSLYLQEMANGSGTNAATASVIKAHFDYDDKTYGQMILEIFIPFMSFTFKNMEYYAEVLSRNAHLGYQLVNIMAPIWDFDSMTTPNAALYQAYDRSFDMEKILQFDPLTPWVNINQSLLYHTMAGNIKHWTGLKALYPGWDAKEELRNLVQIVKLNPSYMDAYNFLSDPVGAMYERMLPIWKIWEYGEMDITKAPVIGALLQRFGYDAKKTPWDKAVDTGNPLNLIPSLFSVSYVKQDLFKELPKNGPARKQYMRQLYAAFKSGGLSEQYSPYNLYPNKVNNHWGGLKGNYTYRQYRNYSTYSPRASWRDQEMRIKHRRLISQSSEIKDLYTKSGSFKLGLMVQATTAKNQRWKMALHRQRLKNYWYYVK